MVWTVCDSRESREGAEYLHTPRQKEQSGHVERHIIARSGLEKAVRLCIEIYYVLAHCVVGFIYVIALNHHNSYVG